MKPRLRVRFGIWACGRMFGPLMLAPIGYGHNPEEAFRDFEQLFAPSGAAA